MRDDGHEHHWMGLLDPDEFVEMRHTLHPTLLGWLRHWGEKGSVEVDGKYVKSQGWAGGKDEKMGQKLKVGALSVSWLPHNSAGLNSTPTTGGFRGIFNEYVTGGPVANETRGDFFTITYSKWIVYLPAFQSLINIHLPVVKGGWARFNEQGGFDGSISNEPASHEYWALHHYATDSREYFERK